MRMSDVGPFGSAVVSAIVPAGLLIALAAGLKIEMNSVLTIMVPATTLAALMVSVSIAWIFILIGRLHRQPLWIPATMFVIGITMLELLAVLIITTRAG
jgi:hypothetical protein